MDVVNCEIRAHQEAGRRLPMLLWRFSAPMRCISSAPLGGGIGERRWVINAQVPSSYARRDPDRHLAEMASSLGLAGTGVGMMTAARVDGASRAVEDGAVAVVTVGLGHPILAAATESDRPALVGTINVVVLAPERLGDAALVNAVATVAEAKAQALRDLGLNATGTATDAVCVACPAGGRPHPFGGPRSEWGSRIARAVHEAVLVAEVQR